MWYDNLICEDCGKVQRPDDKDDIEEGFCPYASSIDMVEVNVVLCTTCYMERVRRI